MQLVRDTNVKMAEDKIRPKIEEFFIEKSIMSTEDRYDMLMTVLSELYIDGYLDEAWLASYIDGLKEAI